MVLTQPGTVIKDMSFSQVFPYHYGSYATSARMTPVRPALLFPYHYGSYATCKQIKRPAQSYVVSIPLWFLRNEETS